ncbi:Ubiquitin fusion degradation 1 [Gossypium australe]|uniref:Ubiquitin fusion degradation 1 n=1 Tax=Gossypium australe TaxID=47621 RepID=A0A5B6VZE8_9ROSI|nr:Ubiquitin fusion degradation 1 [Gossypium australe]
MPRQMVEIPIFIYRSFPLYSQTSTNTNGLPIILELRCGTYSQVSVHVQENSKRKVGQQAMYSSLMELDTVECRNCNHFIPSRSIALHEAYCSRHNVVCPFVDCGIVVRIEDDKNHVH